MQSRSDAAVSFSIEHAAASKAFRRQLPASRPEPHETCGGELLHQLCGYVARHDPASTVVLSPVERILFGRGEAAHGSAFDWIASDHVLAERFDCIDDGGEIVGAKATFLVHRVAFIEGGAKQAEAVERGGEMDHSRKLGVGRRKATPTIAGLCSAPPTAVSWCAARRVRTIDILDNSFLAYALSCRILALRCSPAREPGELASGKGVACLNAQCG
jgi:hypothetical protein